MVSLKMKGNVIVRYDAVLFDMDGLLLDTERQYLNTFIATCDVFGLSGMDEVYYDCIGLRFVDNQKVLEKGLGHLVDLSAFLKTWDDLTNEARSKSIPVKPGAFELLNHLQAAGIPRVVATSTGTEKAIHHLKKAGLFDLLTGVLGGDQVTMGKPNPEVYLKAAELAGTSASLSTAFEDSDPGARAAHASGATTVQVPDLKYPSDETCALGHIIAQDLLSGARQIGLIDG